MANLTFGLVSMKCFIEFSYFQLYEVFNASLFSYILLKARPTFPGKITS